MKANFIIFIIIIFFGVLLPYSMPDFDKFLSSSVHTVSIFITIIIWLLLLIGIFQYYKLKRLIGVEIDYLDSLKLKSIKKLREMYSNEEIKTSINEIALMLPQRSNLIVDRLFEHIVQEGRLRRIDSSLNTIATYKVEYEALYIPLRTFQKLSLQLGILGTFIGLISAFQQLGLEASSTENFEVAGWITPLQKALEYSFSTSIVGLQSAVSISLLLLISRDNLITLASKLEETCDTFIR